MDPRVPPDPRSFDLKVGSHNVNDLNVPQKHTMAFSDYFKLKLDVLLLQETHFRKTSSPKYLSKYYPQKSEGRVIVGGDFNTTINNNLDRSRDILDIRTTSTDDRDTKHLVNHLKEKALVDVWREKHPIDRDYTYYSSVHATYSLHYYNISTLLKSITSPDHGIVETLFNRWDKDKVRGGGNWRLNDSLLLDRDICMEIKNTINEYFQNNIPADTSLAIRWDAHKAVIRGILIKHASRIKRIKEEKIKQLSQKLHDVATAHKNSQPRKKCREIQNLGTQLIQSLSEKYQ
ncbi:hypothetical protein XELAEV_18027793mg [Xenopus laevis]|uniref:Endonuclease/exonuclease/phosphatase domain-containing protein n=1 Tax=Xenopus laevis TaxID=8355 RepID=A0A974CYA0_XENLA|nr:hypothetical protein XELAEV_18027793mg [Xenopus laevis]